MGNMLFDELFICIATLLCAILGEGGGVQTASFGEKIPPVHLIIIIE